MYIVYACMTYTCIYMYMYLYVICKLLFHTRHFQATAVRRKCYQSVLCGI